MVPKERPRLPACVLTLTDILLPMRTFLESKNMRVHELFADIDVNRSESLDGRELCLGAEIALNCEFSDGDKLMVQQAIQK